MHYLHLLSGAAFIAAGAVLAAEARVIDAGLPLPRGALAYLGVFALATGATEWADMAVDIEAAARGTAPAVLMTLHLALVAASYGLLLAFADALRASGRAPTRLPALGGAALAAWSVALSVWLYAHRSEALADVYTPVEALTRWLFGLPAGVCAASGLLGLARTVEPEDWAMARLVRGAGWILLVYGVLAAVLVGPEPPHPAWSFSPHGLGQGLGVATEVARAVCGAAIAVLLSEAFVFQTSQRLRREETHLRDDFVALVTHELGNPVAALELAAERLDANRRTARPIDAGLSADVRACSLTLRRIVMDLLDTSRIHARTLEVVPAAVELRPIIERAAAVTASIDGQGRAVTVSCPEGLVVWADTARLDQILRNLLSNAVKYSSPGSPVSIEAVVALERVTIRVVNEGPRIASREVSRIFSQRYRARDAAAGAAQGQGIGLYVARGLVEAHGGRIWIERHEPRTAFCFTVPLTAPADAGPPAQGLLRRLPGANVKRHSP